MSQTLHIYVQVPVLCIIIIITSEIKKQTSDFRRDATYGSGIALKASNCLPRFVLEDDAARKKLKSQRCVLLGCFGRNHATSSSKSCYYYDCRNNDEFVEKMKSYLKATYPEKYGKYIYWKLKWIDWKNSHIDTYLFYIFYMYLYNILRWYVGR